MKTKTRVRFALLVLCFSLLFSFPSNAALTDKQKESLISYTEKFINDGNAAGLLQYGSVENYRSINFFLTQCSSLYKKSWIYNEQTGEYDERLTRVLYMLNPAGYSSLSAYNAENNGSNPYFKSGNYFILDCSSFYSLMFKAVFGLSLDYVWKSSVYGGRHASNWTSQYYFDLYDKTMHPNPDVMKVYSLDGEVIDLFDEVYAKYVAQGQPNVTVAEQLTPILSQLETGDVIIGYNANSGLGHFMFYAGDGYLYHSSSTVKLNSDGSVYPYLIRKELVSDLSRGGGYTHLRVLRLADGILEDDFDGWNVPINFSSLSTSSNPFDTKAPYLEAINIVKNGQNFTITATASDEYGSLKPLSFYHEPNVIYKSSGYGESGVLGIAMNTNGVKPDLYYTSTSQTNYFTADKSKVQSFSKVTGTHYLWIKDKAENISDRYKIVLLNNSSFVYSSPIGKPENLLASFIDYSKYPIKCSDLNNDGVINSNDINFLFEHITYNNRRLAADSDGNGESNVLDAIKISINTGKTPEMQASY